jgi:hypothetical protein
VQISKTSVPYVHYLLQFLSLFISNTFFDSAANPRRKGGDCVLIGEWGNWGQDVKDSCSVPHNSEEVEQDQYHQTFWLLAYCFFHIHTDNPQPTPIFFFSILPDQQIMVLVSRGKGKDSSQDLDHGGSSIEPALCIQNHGRILDKSSWQYGGISHRHNERDLSDLPP